MNVAYTIFNRVDDSRFPNSVIEVISQPNQYSYIGNANYNKAKVTNFTKENVKKAFINNTNGIDGNGALYFTRGSFNKTYLFTDSVGHNFYK